MVLVYLKNLLFPRTRQSDPESQSPLLRDGSHDYSAFETDFTTPNAKNPPTTPICPTKCPRPDCPRLVRRRSTSSDATDFTIGSTNDSWISPRTVSDAIIGLSDGLTVPFALTAGLSAFNDTRVVLFGGLAELIAGSISMGLGGWLAGRGEAEFYNQTLANTRLLVANAPDSVSNIVHSVFAPYRVPPSATEALTVSLQNHPTKAVDFLMAFHHRLSKPENGKRTPLTSALTIAAGYFIGGFIPLSPYFFVGTQEVIKGLWWSVGVMAVCLFVFGAGKEEVVGEGSRSWGQKIRGGIEMVLVGGVAAGASWGIVRALER